MRREGRLHGYEFDRRDDADKRVKACTQPTNRSKYRPKFPQEKVGLPRCKALKKMKGQRNKAHGIDVAANHKMHEWALHTRPASAFLSESAEDIELDPAPLPQPLAILLGDLPLYPRTRPAKGRCPQTEIVEDEDDFDDSDWLDVGFPDDASHGIDDWYLC